MARCIIFCAAACDALIAPIEADDYVIAADGGLSHTVALNIEPNEILGDFDSLGYIPTDSRVFPTEKDDTDAMLAARRGLELGYREFVLYGSLDGPRLDHTLANIQLLRFLADHGACGYLVGLSDVVTLAENTEIVFPRGCKGTLSVFCMGGDAHGVMLEGLYYPLENADLSESFPIGVSNRFTGNEAKISVADGALIVLWDRCNAFPNRRTLSVKSAHKMRTGGTQC